MHHGHSWSSEKADPDDLQQYLDLPVPPCDSARALIVEPLVDAGILLVCLIGQEHSVYRDVVVLIGERGGEQSTILAVLGILHVLDELPDCGLILPSNRHGLH